MRERKEEEEEETKNPISVLRNFKLVCRAKEPVKRGKPARRSTHSKGEVNSEDCLLTTVTQRSIPSVADARAPLVWESEFFPLPTFPPLAGWVLRVSGERPD